MKAFTFQQFVIEQSKSVFAVGTDGVLLGALCNIHFAEKILEIGTGTGLIALMMAQRNPQAEIHTVDINPDAVALARKNFAQSPFRDRLSVSEGDISVLDFDEQFDSIVCNPPFFRTNTSKKHIIARQQITLSYEQLIQKSAMLLSPDGRFSVIIPSIDSKLFIDKSEEQGLFLHRHIHIYGIDGGKEIRAILEFSRTKTDISHENFTIEQSPRLYSEQYLEATKEFHI